MSLGMMKKLGSVRRKRAGFAGVHGVGAKAEMSVEWEKAIAGKPAPTGYVSCLNLEADTNPCGSGLARD
ncbi:hypothetical protein DJ564_28590 [Pseudomonas sp. 31-12]|nr:hypothetical protein DJ564_28590 [Pseudomonas sp. 31-12]